MAEEGEDDLTLGAPEAGLAFKGEMVAMNFLLGYWKHLLAVLAVILLSVLFWGQWKSFEQRTQRAATQKISKIEQELPVAIVTLPNYMASGQADVTNDDLNAVAADLEAVTQEVSGTAATEAFLKAAELYRITGDNEGQRRALEAAYANSPTGPLGYAAQGSLANLDLEQGNGDKAVERLTRLREDFDGYLAEQAALDLARALESLDRGDEARQVYASFLERWPDSDRAEEVRSRRDRLGG